MGERGHAAHFVFVQHAEAPLCGKSACRISLPEVEDQHSFWISSWVSCQERLIV